MSGWKGIYPILYAFWDRNGGLDADAMRAQVDHCVASGAHGIAVLGLVTETHKMDLVERLALMDMVGAQIAGRLPYAVTINEPSERGQIAFARRAEAAGASWVILQPPPIKGTSQADLIRFFGRVAEAVSLDIAVQNNPVNLDVSLSVDGLVALNRAHPNIRILKGEGFSLDIQQAIEGSGGAYRVFGGHGGIEFPALLRSGGAGLIPAPDFLAAQVRMFELWQAGRTEEAEAIHRLLLPTIVFMSRSVPAMLCYGKRLFARQIGLPDPIDRAPALQPTAFGLAELDRFAAEVARAAEVGLQGPPLARASAE